MPLLKIERIFCGKKLKSKVFYLEVNSQHSFFKNF